MSDAPVLITAALPFECRPLVALLSSVEVTQSSVGRHRWRGTHGGVDVVVQETGMGLEAAAESTAHALRETNPRLVLSVGLAGGIAPAVGLADAIAPDRVARERGDDILVDVDLRALSAPFLPEKRSRRGRLVSVDRVVRSPTDKAELAAATRADAVDMESAAILESARDTGIPAIVLRAASDTATDDLPDLSAIDPTKPADQLRLVGRALTSPRTAVGLVRLGWGGHRAMGTVVEVLEKLLPCLKI